MNWHVICTDCQEPVGKPVWANGCACEGELDDYRKRLLRVINEMWDLLEWEPAP